MGKRCLIKSCPNSTNKKDRNDLMFHEYETERETHNDYKMNKNILKFGFEFENLNCRFTADAVRRENWIINIQVLANQIGKISSRAIICSDHFAEDAYERKPDGSRTLSRNAEPTLFQFTAHGSSKDFENVEKLSINYMHNNDQLENVPIIDNACPSKFTRNDNGFSLESRYLLPSQESSQKLRPQMPVLVPDVKLEQEQKLKPVIVPAVKHKTDVTVKSDATPRIRIRYPGDLFDMDNMSRMQLKRCVQMCKEKVDSQAGTIKALRRQIHAKDGQIARLRSVVKGLKKSN